MYGNLAISYKQVDIREGKMKQAASGRGTFATGFARKPESTKPINKTKCTYCSSSTHTVADCKEILFLNHKDRYEHLKNKGLCFGCLKHGHKTVDCKYRAICSICNRRHPSILHNPSWISADNDKIKTDKGERDEEEHPSVCTNYVLNTNSQTGAGDVSCATAIIPVRVKSRNKPHSIEAYAFFDSGSSVSFCIENIMCQLGRSGKRMQITLNTMETPHKMYTYALNGLQICDLDMTHIVEMPKVYTKDQMPVSTEPIPKEKELSQWSHLSGIKLPKLDDAHIGLMIGNNVPDAYAPFEVATGPSGSPGATKTRLGWIIWTLIRDQNCGIDTTNLVVNRAHISAFHETEKMQLDQVVEKYINYDFPERLLDDKRESSMEEKTFLKQMRNSICHRNEHYYLSLPFRDENMKLPNNAVQGLQRLKALKNKHIKDKKLRQDYTDFTNKLLQERYMEPVPEEELNRDDGKVCYIPHHAVYHSQKPDKIRVVFDCSASYFGVSLNKQLLQGPDLTNNLLGVLLRFHEEEVAILGDIEAMFHQVRVPKVDRDCLRFFSGGKMETLRWNRNNIE